MIPLFFLRPFAQSVTPPLPASDGLQAAMVILEPIWGFGAGLLVLLLLLLWRRPGAEKPAKVGKTGKTPRWIIVDGSNVLHWQDNAPNLKPLQQVIKTLDKRGFAPGVVFDANAGYKLKGRYLNEKAFGRLLSLPADRVFVVPKGEPADPYILSMARELNVSIVTNDRYRDWVEDHPEVMHPGFLISGASEGGQISLNRLDAARVGAAA